MGHCIHSYFFQVVSFPQKFNKYFIHIFFLHTLAAFDARLFLLGLIKKFLTQDANIKRRQNVIEAHVFLFCACLASKDEGGGGGPLGAIYILSTISEVAVD